MRGAADDVGLAPHADCSIKLVGTHAPHDHPQIACPVTDPFLRSDDVRRGALAVLKSATKAQKNRQGTFKPITICSYRLIASQEIENARAHCLAQYRPAVTD